ncbi:MAG: DUF1648 domain-containing protein [Stygiobacter sp.]
MFNEKLAKSLFLIVLLISLLLPIYFYDQLPERIASHFNFRNEADGWMNKSSYLFLHYGLIFFFVAIFSGLGYLMPRFPASLINIPNKNYWLNDKRKNFTFTAIRALLFYLNSLCLLLFIVIDYLVYKANISGTNKLWSFSWFIIVAFLIATGYLTIKLIIFFNNKENQTGEE